MEFIAHRINTLEELKRLPKEYGVELDVRAFGEDLVLAHEPFVKGESLKEFLNQYAHGTLILNMKCEQLEPKVLTLLRSLDIKDYFFLDSSVPMINRLILTEGESNIAVRFSELEPIEGLIPFKGKVNWVWVDCFTKFALTKELEERIHEMGFKICLVSPELQARPEDILDHVNIVKSNNLRIDAVCAKSHNRSLWFGH